MLIITELEEDAVGRKYFFFCFCFVECGGDLGSSR
jgi:hypothetical protein